MNRTIMICLSVLLVALGLTACTQAVSKAAAEQSAVPSAADSTEQNVLPESTEPPAPEMIDFEVNRYAVTAGAAAYLGSAEEQYKALVDAVCSKKETEIFLSLFFVIVTVSPYSSSSASSSCFSTSWLLMRGMSSAERNAQRFRQRTEQSVFRRSYAGLILCDADVGGFGRKACGDAQRLLRHAPQHTIVPDAPSRTHKVAHRSLFLSPRLVMGNPSRIQRQSL